MKIKTNFIGAMPRLLPKVFMGVWAGVLLLSVLASWMLWNTITLKTELPQIQEKLPELARLVAQADDQAMPAPTQLREMQSRVARLNSIPQGKGLTSLAVLAKLEALLPDEVVLTGVHLRSKEREVQLLAQAGNTEALSQFLLKLERDPQLESVVLVQQKDIQESDTSVMQFEIRFKVRA